LLQARQAPVPAAVMLLMLVAQAARIRKPLQDQASWPARPEEKERP
jgi:hypothetical protein